MKNFSWIEIEAEFAGQFPELHKLCKILATPANGSTHGLEIRLAMIYAILMQSRCKEMSLVQHVVSAVLTEHNVPQKVNLT